MIKERSTMADEREFKDTKSNKDAERWWRQYIEY